MAAAGEGGGEGRNRSAQVSKLSQRRVKGSGASMLGVDLFSPQLTYVDAPFPDLYFHPDLFSPSFIALFQLEVHNDKHKRPGSREISRRSPSKEDSCSLQMFKCKPL